jgi:hypothetical protein
MVCKPAARTGLRSILWHWLAFQNFGRIDLSQIRLGDDPVTLILPLKARIPQPIQSVLLCDWPFFFP